jgi:hypothetical protein
MNQSRNTGVAMKNRTQTKVFVLSCLSLMAASCAPAQDWPQWRGPEQNGISRETGLIDTWDPNGGAEGNVLWKNTELGGISTPIVMRGKLYVLCRHNPDTITEGEKVADVFYVTRGGKRITDEQQYSQIARSIVAGDGFAWAPGQPTSIRPPLYPGLLAALWSISPDNLQAVRGLQILLSLATAALVYILGSRIYGAQTGVWAAAVCWLYPSFIFFDFLILTETLFTFLLVAVVLIVGALTDVDAHAFDDATTPQ